jgi:hypothetical protein
VSGARASTIGVDSAAGEILVGDERSDQFMDEDRIAPVTWTREAKL